MYTAFWNKLVCPCSVFSDTSTLFLAISCTKCNDKAYKPAVSAATCAPPIPTGPSRPAYLSTRLVPDDPDDTAIRFCAASSGDTASASPSSSPTLTTVGFVKSDSTKAAATKAIITIRGCRTTLLRSSARGSVSGASASNLSARLRKLSPRYIRSRTTSAIISSPSIRAT